jgi:hypothetical protein
MVSQANEVRASLPKRPPVVDKTFEEWIVDALPDLNEPQGQGYAAWDCWEEVTKSAERYSDQFIRPTLEAVQRIVAKHRPQLALSLEPFSLKTGDAREAGWILQRDAANALAVWVAYTTDLDKSTFRMQLTLQGKVVEELDCRINDVIHHLVPPLNMQFDAEIANWVRMLLRG